MGEQSARLAAPITVTVHAPSEVIGDLEAFQKVQASVFDRFGCGGCNSGINIDWRHFRDFYVTPDLQLEPAVGVNRQIG